MFRILAIVVWSIDFLRTLFLLWQIQYISYNSDSQTMGRDPQIWGTERLKWVARPCERKIIFNQKRASSEPSILKV